MKQGNSTYDQRLTGQMFFTLLVTQPRFARKSAMSRMYVNLVVRGMAYPDFIRFFMSLAKSKFRAKNANSS